MKFSKPTFRGFELPCTRCVINQQVFNNALWSNGGVVRAQIEGVTNIRLRVEHDHNLLTAYIPGL